MADTTARVQEWRQRLKEEGKTPLTIYLTPDEKLRLRDLADNWHCSVSDMVQQALAAFHPGSPAAPGAVANTAQIRELIREELTHLFPPEVAISLGKHTPAESVTEMFSNVSVTDAPQQTSQPDYEQVSPPPRPLDVADLGAMPEALVAIAPEPAYDLTADYLGPLCANNHNWKGTGQSPRRTSDHECRQCRRDRDAAYKARKRQAAPVA